MKLSCFSLLIIFAAIVSDKVYCASTAAPDEDDDDWDGDADADGDGDSSEADDDGRVYKNPRNSPSPECPRDEEQATLLGQKCLRKCSSDEDCKSKKKKCLCDGACGMSCIKPDRECPELPQPPDGSVSLSGRLFGARASYSCPHGYHVVGLQSRACQADGQWAGQAPTCKQNIYCLTPPTIEHARHSALPEQATFDLESTVQYHCHMGYATNGFPRAKCLEIDGNGQASWYGPDISCEPRSCGPPADTAHGWHAGECYTYGCRVIYHCAEGFELVGKEDRFCQADGSWAPKDLPMCVLVTAVQCAPPENPRFGKAVYTSCAYNSVVSYECKYGYTLIGDGTRRCGADKKWSGVLPVCKEINCGHPGILYNGWLENIEAGTGLGASIIFRCHDNMTLQGHTSSVCQIDGRWRYPLPQCLAPCVVPQVVQGRVVLASGSNLTDTQSSNPGGPAVVPHGQGLTVECEAHYEFPQAGLAPVTCNNGTWTLMPKCQPARCKQMPKSPRNGMVIAPKTEHGMRARFKCKDGYTLTGKTEKPYELVCSFGNWTGEPPLCQEVYCPFPGYIDNGKVLLVGNMGLYDYRPYVRKVVNNKQIMYDCDKGYVLGEGPPGATCIGGHWSPKELPRCLPGQHPRLRWSRRRRSLNDNRYLKFLQYNYALRHPEEELTTEGLLKGIEVRAKRASSIKIASDKKYYKIKKNIFKQVNKKTDLKEKMMSKIKFIHYADKLKDKSANRVSFLSKDEKSSKLKDSVDNHFVKSIMEPKIRVTRALQRETGRANTGMGQYGPDGKRTNRRQGLGANQTALLLQNSREDKQDSREEHESQESSTRKPKVKGPCEVLSTEPYVNIEIVRVGRDPQVPFSSGTIVRMACGKGYGLNLKQPNATAKCVRGRWKPMKPMCLILPCLVPTTENGIYSLSATQTQPLGNWTTLRPLEEVGNGQVVEFSCEQGYSSQGPNNMRCWHGDWAVSSLPECTPGPCQLPVTPNAVYQGGYRAGLTIAHGSSVVVQCEGETGNPISLSCNFATLSPAAIHCQPVEKAQIRERTDEFLGGSDIVKGGDITVPGDTTGRSCGPPARVQGSVVYRDGEPLEDNSEGFPAGTEVTFNCIASILGERTTWRIICEDGSWIGRSLNCDGEEPMITGAILGNGSCFFRNNEPHVVSFYNDQEIREEVVEFQPGAVLVSRCVDIGKYAMIGSSRRRCVGSEWDGQKPSCFGLNQENDYAMEKPPTILFRHQLGPIAQSNDGRLIVYPGTILHMECLWMRRFGNPKWTVSHEYRKYPEGWSADPGRDPQLEYRLSVYHAARDDSGLFTCVTPARHTHSVEIVVKAVHCPAVPIRRGLTTNTGATRMGTKLQLSCANGNSLIGTSEITCLPSGNWSAPFPVCESVECGEVPLPQSGNISVPRIAVLSREVGGRVAFSCQGGFGLRGPQESLCLPSGEWAIPFPTCVEVQCEPPGAPQHGYAQGNGPYRAGDVVQFNCNPEYMMQGQPIIACQDSGRWSGPIPKCVQACSYPGTAISGRMSSVKFYYQIGETITFTCDPGLELRGARMLKCLRNGKWSNAIPTCTPAPHAGEHQNQK